MILVSTETANAMKAQLIVCFVRIAVSVLWPDYSRATALSLDVVFAF